MLQDGDRQPSPLPDTTALGALARHLTESNPKRYQPTNINYGLLEPLAGRVRKRERRGRLRRPGAPGARGLGR